MRLDRVLANASVGSRTQVKNMVKKGRVCVNGEVVLAAGRAVDPNQDVITIDGEELAYSEHYYFMLHKPAGYISATEGRHNPTVLELVPDYKGLFPCGRLDKDTEGLLLIMNDGPLAHELLSPKKHVEKEYYVEHQSPLSKEDIKAIEKGVEYRDISYKGAKLHILDERSCTIVVQEGKYHEIKNIFLSLGNKVMYLKRIRMKNLILDETLKKGEYRPLSKEEIEDLKKLSI
ncbi:MULTISPECIES: pseudouridine synthase [Terrabacteria group]|uniref:pseudouridine synthase n=1 Tax=Bacillati TaxID=1783272 RepID=UPI001C6DD675|nr:MULTISPECIES: pseudouridine synthase [Terrabacteria group]MBW9212393.1 rRNA pseudouridine synthase [Trueperella sp. zg.1013]